MRRVVVDGRMGGVVDEKDWGGWKDVRISG